MSDDGYYAGSPYDDLDDVYYDDDVGENLADDLAEHTLPSPIYHEDPAYEMIEYYSDWDYYSDDYYDDDPALLNGQAQEGSKTSSRKTAKVENAPTRVKKRKLADTKDIPNLALDNRPTLAATVRGTVWRDPKPKSPKPYEVGRGQKISLLKNWAQIFERSSPRSMLRRDESWANDLGLEDMGLRRIESKPALDGVAPEQDQADEGEEEEVVGVDQMEDNLDQLDEDEEEMLTGDELDDGQPTKRQRTEAPLPSPPPSYKSSNTSTDAIVENMKNTSMTGRLPAKSTSGQSKKTYPGLTQTTKIEVAETTVKTRKRKASPDEEVSNAETTKSTASTRSKRVASSKLATAKEERPPPMPTTRATRSRKK